MNLVGKIFTLLIMLMSIVFASFAVMVYATHRNWRDMVLNEDPNRTFANGHTGLGYKKLLEDAGKTIADLSSVRDDLEQELAAVRKDRDEQVAKIRAERDNAMADVARLTQQNNELDIKAREAAEAAKGVQLANNSYREDVGRTRRERDHAINVQSDFFKRIYQLQSQVHEGQAEVDRLNDLNREMAGRVVNLQDVLAYHGITEHTPENQRTPPRVEGLILALSEDRNLVTISIGSDDGVLRSHELEVFRLGTTPKYLCRVRVVDSKPDRAVAEVIPETRQGKIEKFDHVATKLR